MSAASDGISDSLMKNPDLLVEEAEAGADVAPLEIGERVGDEIGRGREDDDDQERLVDHRAHARIVPRLGPRRAGRFVSGRACLAPHDRV